MKFILNIGFTVALIMAASSSTTVVEGKESNLRTTARRAEVAAPTQEARDDAATATTSTTTNKKKHQRRQLFETATVPYLVKPKQRGDTMCLDTKNDFLYFHECGDSSSSGHEQSQHWYRDTDGHIKNKSLGSDKCLDYYEYEGVTFLKMIDCNTATEHGWDYNTYKIVSNYDQKCLELYDTNEVMHNDKHQITLIATSDCNAMNILQIFNLVEYNEM